MGEIYDHMAKIAESIDCASGYIVLFLTDKDMLEEVKEYVESPEEKTDS